MDVERTMEFILQSQASVAANLGALERNLASLEQRQNQLEGIVGRVVGLCETLTSAQVRFQNNLEQLTESVKVLAEKQAASDDRLNALIRIVDDVIRRDIQ